MCACLWLKCVHRELTARSSCRGGDWYEWRIVLPIYVLFEMQSNSVNCSFCRFFVYPYPVYKLGKKNPSKFNWTFQRLSQLPNPQLYLELVLLKPSYRVMFTEWNIRGYRITVMYRNGARVLSLPLAFLMQCVTVHEHATVDWSMLFSGFIWIG